MLLAQANPSFDLLALVAGWVILVFVAALGGVIVWAMFTGVIDLTKVISEPNGDASMSRLQLLIFTFVIAVSLYLIIVYNHAFPAVIPQGILVLLGISSSSYLVSKGIQFSSEAGIVEGDPAITISPTRTTVKADGKSTVQFTAKLVKVDKITWTLKPASPAGGTISADGLYTAPATLPPPTPGAAAPATEAFVEVHATSVDKASIFDAAVVHLT